MKTNKQLFLLLIASIYLCGTVDVNAQRRRKRKANKETAAFRYEVQCFGTGIEGTYSLKVYSYSKKPAVAKEQCKKNAIHGIIFKGVAPGPRCRQQQPALAGKDAIGLYDKNRAFFDDFFSDGGSYMQFVSISNDGNILPGDIIKVSRKEYKVGLIVSVQKEALRKYLEDNGIIKKLYDGF